MTILSLFYLFFYIISMRKVKVLFAACVMLAVVTPFVSFAQPNQPTIKDGEFVRIAKEHGVDFSGIKVYRQQQGSFCRYGHTKSYVLREILRLDEREIYALQSNRDGRLLRVAMRDKSMDDETFLSRMIFVSTARIEQPEVKAATIEALRAFYDAKFAELKEMRVSDLMEKTPQGRQFCQKNPTEYGYAVKAVSRWEYVAQKLGMTEEEIRAELKKGNTIAKLAAEKGVTFSMPSFPASFR